MSVLAAIPLLLLATHQIFEHISIANCGSPVSGQSRTAKKSDKIEPINDRPWEPIPYMRTKLSILGIAVFDFVNVWIVAEEGEATKGPYLVVFRSNDEGKTWQKSRLDFGTFPFDIYFIDRQNGWIVGAEGLILRTTDAGRSWSKQFSSTDSHLTRIRFIDGLFGWIAGDDGEFIRTTDGGCTWRSHKIPGNGWVGDEFRGWLNAFSFGDRLHGWLVGDQSKVFETTDGGSSWRLQLMPVERAVGKRRNQTLNLTDVHFFDARSGILLADAIEKTDDGERHHPSFLKTGDGGRSWQKLWSLEAGPLSGLNFVSATEGWMTTSFGREFVHTTNGGRSWLAEDVPGVDTNNFITGAMFAIKMIDSKRGWAAVSVNDFPVLHKVVRTTDGGRTWRDVKLDSQ